MMAEKFIPYDPAQDLTEYDIALFYQMLLKQAMRPILPRQ